MKKRLINMLSLVSLICMTACGTQPKPPVAEVPEQTPESAAVTERSIPAADVKEAPQTELDRLISETKDKVALTVWVPDEEMDITSSLIETFKAQYSDVEFDITLEAKAEDDIYDTVSGDKAQTADVFEFTDMLLPAYAEAGLLAEAGSSYIYDINENATKGAIASATFDNKLLAYPVAVAARSWTIEERKKKWQIKR